MRREDERKRRGMRVVRKKERSNQYERIDQYIVTHSAAAAAASAESRDEIGSVVKSSSFDAIAMKIEEEDDILNRR